MGPLMMGSLGRYQKKIYIYIENLYIRKIKIILKRKNPKPKTKDNQKSNIMQYPGEL